MTRALLIPANVWQPATYIEVPTTKDGCLDLKVVRNLLSCQLVEFLYCWPDSPLEQFDEGKDWDHIVIGDEEGRLVQEPEANIRATQLLGMSPLFPFVGDALVAGDKRTPLRAQIVDAHDGLLDYMTHKTYMEEQV